LIFVFSFFFSWNENSSEDFETLKDSAAEHNVCTSERTAFDDCFANGGNQRSCAAVRDAFGSCAGKEFFALALESAEVEDEREAITTFLHALENPREFERELNDVYFPR
jgi:hypothetical protein